MRTMILNATAVTAIGLLVTFAAPNGAAATNRNQRVDPGPSTMFPNVRVSHDGFLNHAEPSLAVNPRNPLNLLGATMMMGTLSQPARLGTFVSFDGGRTWQDNGTLPLPPNTTYGDDVTVAFDTGGTGFVDAMATSGLQRQDRGVYVWRTDDGGRHFHPPVAAMIHQFADHPWLAVDTTNGPGTGDLYATWVAQDHSALGFSRSVDGGRSFTPPRNISRPPGGVSIPVVGAGPAGAVYVAYESSRQGADPLADSDAGPQVDMETAHTNPSSRRYALQAGPDAQVEVVSSTNHGRTFGQPVTLGPVSSELTPAPGLRLPTGPSVATDPRDGTVYVAYAAYSASTSHADIVVLRSRDHGRTWSGPVRVTAGSRASGAVYFQPQVVVDDSGSVDVSYFALVNGHIDVMLARSDTHGAGIEAHLRITDRSFNPALGLGGGGKHGLWWIGDYQGLAAGGGMIHAFWNDTRTGHLEIFTAAVPISTTR